MGAVMSITIDKHRQGDCRVSELDANGQAVCCTTLGVPFLGRGVDMGETWAVSLYLMLNYVLGVVGARQGQLSAVGHRIGQVSPAQRPWCSLTDLK